MHWKIYDDIPPDKAPAYKEFLLRHESTLFYQSLSYHRLLKKHLDAQSVYFTCWHDDELIATMPFLYKSAEQGTVFNSLPYYGSNGGFVISRTLPVQEQNRLREDCLREITGYARSLSAVLVTIVCNPFDPESENWLEQHFAPDYTDQRIGQITRLPEAVSEEGVELMHMFSDPRPRNIRKALKSGITFQIHHDAGALGFLYKVHEKNIQDIGGLPKREAFFTLIPDFFGPKEYAVFIAYQGKTPVAGLLLFYFNRTVEYFTPAILYEYRNLQPLSLLIFEAMKDAVKRGFLYWNWGGTWLTQKGVYDFKKRWGAVDKPYRYFTKVLDKSVLQLPRQQLMDTFRNFYLFPFNTQA
ncbi:MAG: hypothetical protein KatS3mg031_1177 [Chitinophagales bacterium]|nr:MAG: hypothetical protein KatS3mg031_1177 [Chitinophagales bacterium]